MKHSTTHGVLLTILSSVTALKVHDGLMLTEAPGTAGEMVFGPDSPEQESRMADLFQAMDLDSSQELDLNELCVASFGYETKEAHKVELEMQMQTLIEQLDEDGSGTLNLEEYEKRESPQKQAEIVQLIQQQGQLRLAQNSTEEMPEDKTEELQERDHPTALVLESLNQSEEVFTSQMASSFVSHAAKRRSNKKQKKWAAKEMGKMEKTICKRFQRSHHQVGRARSWRTHDFSWSKGWHCDGWNDLGPLGCFRPCIDQFGHEYRHGVGAMCYKGCPDGYLDGNLGWCAERCGVDRDLPFLSKECDGWLYCATDVGVCNRRAVEITMSFAGAIVGLIPYVGKPAQGIARAIRVGTKAAIKKALKAAMKQIGRKLIKKAKKNLRKYVKKRGKELVKETAEAILEGGAEELAASAIEEAYPNVKQELEDLAAAVDPTGVADIVQSFAAEDCGPLKVEAIPEDGLVEEFKLAETGVLHYASSCHMCGVNLCETGQVLDANDEAIENFQLGHDMSSWGCSKFQASEYSVIRHGASWPNAVFVIEEDGVAARSHTYSYTGAGECQGGRFWTGYAWNLQQCKDWCDGRWDCKYFSFWGPKSIANGHKRYCTMHSSCTSFDNDPAFSYQKGGTLWNYVGPGYCSDSRLWSGRSTGPEDCKRRCLEKSNCKYFSYWASKWCWNSATCNARRPDKHDASNIVDVYERL